MSVDLDNAYTLMTWAGIGEAPYAMRGLKVQIDPLPQAGQIVRNCNGGPLDLTDPLFRKYRVTIRCTDQRAPPFGGLWPGQLVTLTSPIEMGQVSLSTDRSVTGSNSEDGVTYFRPVLDCFVVAFTQTGDEYGAQHDWTLIVEEV